MTHIRLWRNDYADMQCIEIRAYRTYLISAQCIRIQLRGITNNDERLKMNAKFVVGTITNFLFILVTNNNKLSSSVCKLVKKQINF